MEEQAGQTRVRLAELVAALSLGIDLGFGQPMEHVLRQCRIALRLSELMGSTGKEREAVYYTSLLVNVGCHTDAYEQAKWFGDDIALKSDKYVFDLRGLRSTLAGLRRVGSGSTPLRRLQSLATFLASGHRELDDMIAQHARMASLLAGQLGLPTAVSTSLEASYECWDGSGWPGLLKGEAIPFASRTAQFAEYIEVAHRTGGVDAALQLGRERSGGQFDPALVECLAANHETVFENLDAVDSWQSVIGSEPALVRHVSGPELDSALQAIADFIDLKSPYTLGHSRAVAELARAAGIAAGLTPADVATLGRAALVSGFGRLGVSNAIWDKPGPLSIGERERLRMYPYFTERMLQHSASLSSLCLVASAHRERMDGSGYPRGLSGSAIPYLARILGAADAYQTMREERPHRRALAPGEVAMLLHGDVRVGRLDGDAVDAVLSAAGHRVVRRRESVADLTAREVEVLRLVARGRSNREIADLLAISPKTAANHIEHIYLKIGASNRAMASLFAVRHGLLDQDAIEESSSKMG